jgi:DNA-binding beta-propeller fold protein YncE
MNMQRKTRSLTMAVKCAGLAIALGIFCPQPFLAQRNVPKFEFDPYWPKPMPDRWITGQVGGVCVDAQDRVFILNRRDLTENELDAGHQAPAVIEFDPEGNVVNSFGDPTVLPGLLHDCKVDRENNVWLTGAGDAIVQKYSPNGKLLLQIGKKGVFDSSDGTIKGSPLNASHTAFFKPAGIAIDQKNGDVYVADGESPGGNHRVAVFDRNGQFLRQWELQRTEAEVADLTRLTLYPSDRIPSDAFVPVPHCVAVDVDGQVYVCDRRARQLQVFDRMGNYKKTILIPFEQRSQYQTGAGFMPGMRGSAVHVSFSSEREQKFIYVINEDDEQVEILDRASGQILSSFGRAGHQTGEFTRIHNSAVDSKGNLYIGEVRAGAKVLKFKIVGVQ